MSEDQAPYLEKGDFLVPLVSLDVSGKRVSLSDEPISRNTDPFGAKAVFNAHYDLSIENTHPVQAVKAAYAAALAYAESYEYLALTHKGSDVPEYRIVQKREGKSKA